MMKFGFRGLLIFIALLACVADAKAGAADSVWLIGDIGVFTDENAALLKTWGPDLVGFVATTFGSDTSAQEAEMLFQAISGDMKLSADEIQLAVATRAYNSAKRRAFESFAEQAKERDNLITSFCAWQAAGAFFNGANPFPVSLEHMISSTTAGFLRRVSKFIFSLLLLPK
jgi:hypothetical protein